MISALAVMLLAQANAPVQPSSPIPDQRIAHVGGRDFLLGEHIEDTFFNDSAARQALMRVGLRPGCIAFHDARNTAVATFKEGFEPVLIAAMRETVPAQRLAGAIASYDLVSGKLTFYRSKVTARVKHMRPELFSGLLARFRSDWTAASTKLAPASPGSEAGSFADWQLDKPIALRTACMLIAVSKNDSPETLMKRKSTFDGFYRRSGR